MNVKTVLRIFLAVFFMERLLLCMCCSQILKGGTKKCETCRETIDINKFERPYLLKCKQCVNRRLNTKIMCQQCAKLIPVSSMSKHISSHLPKYYKMHIIDSDYEDDDCI